MRRPSKEMHFEALDFDFTGEIINQGKPDVSLLLLQDKTFNSLACKFCLEELGVHSKPNVGTKKSFSLWSKVCNPEGNSPRCAEALQTLFQDIVHPLVAVSSHIRRKISL
jgi:hypothetical protein